MLTINDLRKSYLGFFNERGHKIVPSSPLIPKDDPTLLFTTAGMVQFKPMFAGTVDLEYTRAASVQKCLRTSDLELVGRTKRHLTFFEMLGNFSFGDYFKKEAIEFAWDYSTNVIGFPKDKIWISIYKEDKEAFNFWKNMIGIPAERIVPLGKKDNFWGPAGDSGACGPCTELHIDRGEEYGCGSKDCKPGCDCERYMEYWNVVFNQYFQDESGTLNPLPKTGIDTGMGLERLGTLVQGVDSVYETDELKSLIEFVSKSVNVPYEGKNMIPIKVIVEHARTLTFAMSDGIYPSNEGRGYVLRRILRRALRYSRQIGIKEPFVYKVIDPIVELMGEFYPEIVESSSNVKNVIKSEENRFLETIENGMDRLEETIKKVSSSGNKIITGKDAFQLYDTFGFPLEMTIEIAEEKGISVDKKEFETEMNNQRERGKSSWKGSEAGYDKIFEEMAKITGDTNFSGYDEDVTDSSILLMHNMNSMSDSISQGDEALIILEKTSFYGESGGQAGDCGEILGKDDALFQVTDTKKLNKTTIHIGKVINGTFNKGDYAKSMIDSVNRNLIRANHTVTHLLQAALREVLGNHVKQTGSLVEANRMRFDFSHFNAMTKEEILKIENIINEKIWENISLTTDISNIDDAVKAGAMAVFDEKYDDVVRVVSIGDYSKELCGGTHVSNSGMIGVFKILKESSPGAGIRRIEGLTLKGVLNKLNSSEKIIGEISNSTGVSENDMAGRVEELIKKNRSLEKEMESIKQKNLASNVDEYINSAKIVNGTKIISSKFKDIDVNGLRTLSDTIRSKEHDSIVCFGSDIGGKAMILFAATKNAVDKGADCGSIIKAVSKIVGGGGGGRKDMAQAGGKDPAGLDEALTEAVKIAEGMVK